MATSKLQRYVSQKLSINFGQFYIRENHRPKWLVYEGARLELDFYIEEMSVAIEVQGRQHYIYVPHFHGDYKNFSKRLSRDYFKRHICSLKNIKLYEVSNQFEADTTILEMYHYVPKEKFVVDPPLKRKEEKPKKKPVVKHNSEPSVILDIRKIIKSKKKMKRVFDLFNYQELQCKIDKMTEIIHELNNSTIGSDIELKNQLRQDRGKLRGQVSMALDFTKTNKFQKIKHLLPKEILELEI